MVGTVGIEPTSALSKSAVLSVIRSAQKTGGASRNRTRIHTLEECCTSVVR